MQFRKNPFFLSLFSIVARSYIVSGFPIPLSSASIFSTLQFQLPLSLPSVTATAFNIITTSKYSTRRRLATTKMEMAATDNNPNSGDVPSPSSSSMPEFTEIQFGKFKISSSQIFFRSKSHLTAAIVNLRPIVPGHVLVVPTRVVPHLSQLTNDEHDDLWRSVRMVQSMLETKYDMNVSTNSGGFNVAVQDGKVAGQSVPHVHVHILPRSPGDFEQNDDVYDELEAWAPTEAMSIQKLEDLKEASASLDVPEDEDRNNRTMQMMEDEAMAYRSLLYPSDGLID